MKKGRSLWSANIVLIPLSGSVRGSRLNHFH